MPLKSKTKMTDAFFNEFVDVVSDRTRDDLGELSLEERIDRFQNHPTLFNAIYFIAGGASKDYHGAKWVMAHCKESDIFFMYPKYDTDVCFEVQGEDDDKAYFLDARIFGLVVSLGAYTCMLHSYHEKGETQRGIQYINQGKKLKSKFDVLVNKMVVKSIDSNPESTLALTFMKDSLEACIGSSDY